MVLNITMLFNFYWVENCREIVFYSQIDGSNKMLSLIIKGTYSKFNYN